MTGRHGARRLRRPSAKTSLVAVLVMLAGLLLSSGTASATVGFKVDGGTIRYDIQLPGLVQVEGPTAGHNGDTVTVLLDGAAVATESVDSDDFYFFIPFTLPGGPAGTNACGGKTSETHSVTVTVGTGTSTESTGTQTLTVLCPSTYALRSTFSSQGGIASASSNLSFSALRATKNEAEVCVDAVQNGQDVGLATAEAGGYPGLGLEVVANPPRAGAVLDSTGQDVTTETPTVLSDGCSNIDLPPVTASYAGTLTVRGDVYAEGTHTAAPTDQQLPGAVQTLQRSRLVSVAPSCSTTTAEPSVSGTRWNPGEHVRVFVNGVASPGTATVDQFGRWSSLVDEDVTLPATVTAEVTDAQGQNPMAVDAQTVLFSNSCVYPQGTSRSTFTAAVTVPVLAAPPTGTTLAHEATGSGVMNGGGITVTVDGVPVQLTNLDGSAAPGPGGGLQIAPQPGVPSPVGADYNGDFDYLFRPLGNEACGTHLVIFTVTEFEDQIFFNTKVATSYTTACTTLSVTPGVNPENPQLVALTISGDGYNVGAIPGENGAGGEFVPVVTSSNGNAPRLGGITSLTPYDPAVSSCSPGQNCGDPFQPPGLGYFSKVQYVPATPCGTTYTMTLTQPGEQPIYSLGPSATTTYTVACPGQATAIADGSQIAQNLVKPVTNDLTVAGYSDGQVLTITYDGDPTLSQQVTYTRNTGDGEFANADLIPVTAMTGSCGSHVYTITPVISPRTPNFMVTPGSSPVATYAGETQTPTPPTVATLPTTAPVEVTCPTAVFTPGTVSTDDQPKTVTVSGSGFDAGSSIMIGDDPSDPDPIVTADDLGRFSKVVTSSDATCGDQSTLAQEGNVESQDDFNLVPNGVAATAILHVTCPGAPTIAVNPTAYAFSKGQREVELTGLGWLPAGAVEVDLDGVYLANGSDRDGDLIVQSSGAFDAGLAMPAGLAVGPHTISVIGPKRQTVSTILTVTRPVLTVTPAAVSSDDFPSTVQVTGSGYDPDFTVAVTLPGGGTTFVAPDAADCPRGVTSCVVAPSDDGSFSFSVNPKVLACGQNQVASGSENPNDDEPYGLNPPTATTSYSITCPNPPTAAATPVIAQAAGTRTVHVTGTGFRSGVGVAVRLDGVGTTVDVTTDGSGNLAADLPVTNPSCTTYPVTLVPTVGFSGATSFRVTCPLLTSSIQAFTEQAVPAVITLTGSGYDAGSDVVVNALVTAHTDANGAFTANIAGTQLICGANTVTGVEKLPGTVPPPQAATTVNETCRPVNPVLVVKPGVVPDGYVVSATASGYHRLTTIHFTWLMADGTQGLGSAVCVADESGSCTVSVLVLPHDRDGARMLVGTDDSAATAQAPVLVVASTFQPSGGSSSVATNRSRLLIRR